MDRSVSLRVHAEICEALQNANAVFRAKDDECSSYKHRVVEAETALKNIWLRIQNDQKLQSQDDALGDTALAVDILKTLATVPAIQPGCEIAKCEGNEQS